MLNKMFSEEQILDEDFRAAVIQEIIGTENVARKQRELRKHEVYKDRTKKYVIEALTEEFQAETVAKMQNRASNISICRKVINKLAQAYTGGVQRSVDHAGSQKAIDELSKLLKLDRQLKKSDRYSELFKNCALQVIPEKDNRESDLDAVRMKLKVRVLPPYLYDVIEDAYDPECPKCFILTDFVERNRQGQLGIADAESDGRSASGANYQTRGDRAEQVIADSPEDKGSQMRTFIWWTESYHFTTDDKGKLIPEMSPEGSLNPVRILPFVTISEDQDGSFWAEGGDDLVDGSVLVNVLLTDMFAIASQQGWGQLVITGKKIERKIQGGPHTAIIMEYDSGDPVPNAEFISSSPPIDAWMQMIEQYVALLLSTNNLSPRNVASKLDVSNAASGIALLIENSESTQDVKEKQATYQDKEPVLFRVIKAWFDYLFDLGSLNEEFTQVGKFEDANVRLKFVEAKPVITEKERLETIEMRQKLGLNLMTELLMMDNPDLTQEQAEEKLKKLFEEKLKQAKMAMEAQIQAQGGQPNEKADADQNSNGNDLGRESHGQEERIPGKEADPTDGAPGSS